jgi:predicted O-linked N-acetylglucosamine transferase (SPINDLY family)
MQDMDIMLDTYPYTGGSTTLDALYMGVPTVTMYGKRRGTRFGYSILNSVGLEELAVSTREDYIKRVVSLANDVELLDLLHKNLRQMMQKSAALSPKQYVQHMENAYEQMLMAREG